MQVQQQQVLYGNVKVKREAKKDIEVQAGSNAFGAPAARGGPFGTITQQTVLPPSVAESGRRECGASDAAPAKDWLDIESDGDEDMGADLMTTTSLVHESPVTLTYHVEGELGVSSDGVPHTVNMSRFIQLITVNKL